jgi:transcriptional regulator with XRE-family HTH domain
MQKSDPIRLPRDDTALELGERLRARRLIRRKSLQTISGAARISIGLLSEIERGISQPSLEILKRICEALEMPMSWLFDPIPDKHGAVVVTNEMRRRMSHGPKGMAKELMTPDAVPEIQMMRITIAPGCSSGDRPYNNPRGAKCGTVVAGQLGLAIDGEEFLLKVGDSFAFPATAMHRYWCVGEETVDLIWVVTPAIY